MEVGATTGNLANMEEITRCSFVQVVADNMHGDIPLHSRYTPKLVGGNIAITIDYDEYEKV